jgi:hypothetical protein
MERQLFYKILAYGLLAILVFDLVRISFSMLNGSSLATFQIAHLKSIFAISIIVYETINATKRIKTINYYLLPVTIIGFLFIIMHWPYGHLLFLGSLLTMLVLLFISAFKSNNNKSDKLIVLVIPFCHYLFMASSMYRLSIVSVIALFEMLIIGGISLTVLYRQAKRI